ncbi:MAG TPA: DUF1577 domain-containing protein, partial [Leptospiraceae bacterium]|nr:DUF1577 domain-containing protein [Leptospiraceae bacterium]
ITVTKLDKDKITLELKPGLRREDYVNAWKAISPYLGPAEQLEKLYSNPELDTKMFQDKTNGLAYKKIAKKYYPKEYANNFHLTRPNADMDEFSVPTFVKITFSDYQNKLSGKFDHIEIDTFKPGLPEKFYLVKSTGKSIYISDTQDLKSYRSTDEEEFLDCTEEFLDDLTDVMKDYRNKKIAAEIIMPVIYLNSTNQAIPIGYVLIQSYTKKIEFDDLMEAKILCFDMIERIRESNTLVYTQRAEIVNLSQDGLRIKITDPELKTQIPVIHGFTMDIVFKMQSPVNVIVLVRNTIRDTNGDIQVGLEIEGFRKGDKERYLDNYSNLARPAKS